ncbi:metallophosphoesterase 1 homolog [Chrysoperla carnea]|uniref:metallophosphoesterase 1 homolog n=1 Tax=Chrysoperla carnea TaxID=189513 RepID=UPI001D0941CF|nr:metallophosphoesterase 1 homolog [Chrysoperla carnea]
MRNKKKSWILIKFFILLSLLFLYCEYCIYYLVIFQCKWPKLNENNKELNVTVQNNDDQPLKVMLLADTHLLGPIKGHWLDKLKREWQMNRAFQAAVTIHSPDIIFILGDLTDEGSWCSKQEFNNYVNRFYKLFKTPEGTDLYVVAGNHDMGFHYGITPYLNERFVLAFSAPSVKLISIKDIHFILINSMALEGDGCFLCRPTELQLNNIQKSLKCAKGLKEYCHQTSGHLSQYSRPIILQHFPLYRESDAKRCEQPDPDGAPEPIFSEVLRERVDCLSKESTYALLNDFVPRLAIGGHTHHSCHRKHKLKNNLLTEEYSISSFSWRNKENPSFLLAKITANNYAIAKCHMPRENTVNILWIIGFISTVAYITLSERNSRRRSWFYMHYFRRKKP